MIAEALQIPVTDQDFQLYTKWTKGKRYKELAFMLALYKVKKNTHNQVVISGEYGHGKTSTGWLQAKWDLIYTKRLLKVYRKDEITEKEIDSMHFRVNDSIIISPVDPASKYLYNPKPWMPYLIDEGEDFTTTAMASTRQTHELKRSIGHNRKKHPSDYWVFPNFFKIPSAILETMGVWIQKENEWKGTVIIPQTVIQIKEKFNRDKVEKWAEDPKTFPQRIKSHKAFIMKVKYPKMNENCPAWKNYLNKYSKYSYTEGHKEATKDSSKLRLFRQIEQILSKKLLNTDTKEARKGMISDLIVKALGDRAQSMEGEDIKKRFTEDYIEWEDGKLATNLVDNLAKNLTKDLAIEGID
jgi:hypothetical protein